MKFLRLTRPAVSGCGCEHAMMLYLLIGTCCLNNVEPEKWLCYEIYPGLADKPGARLVIQEIELISQ
ncbi:hypothetical protein B6R25_25600 [Escherichia coli]|nr:hypothetical protein [Escherichia coli]